MSHTLALDKTKHKLTSDSALTLYDPNLNVILACDDSLYGLSCVLSHVLPNGEHKLYERLIVCEVY